MMWELSISYPINININELILAFKTIVNNCLKSNASIIFKEIWNIIPSEIKDKIRFNLSFYLSDLQFERNFIRSCFEELENE